MKHVLMPMLVCAVGAACAELPIYTVTETVTSGGIDLLSQAASYRTDALRGTPASGAGLAVTGAVTHASGLTSAHPFTVENMTASTYFVLSGANLVGEVPLSVGGAGTTYFADSTLTIDETHDPSLLKWQGVVAQIDNLTVSSKTPDKPARFDITNATLRVRKATYVGRDGGSGTLCATVDSLGRTEGTANSWVGQRGDSSIFLGHSSTKGLGFTSGHVILKSSARGWNWYFGSVNNDPPPEDGRTHYAAEVDLVGSGAQLWTLYTHIRGATDVIWRFQGGYVWSEGWGTFIAFEAGTTANLICEGVDGNPIDLRMTKYSPLVTWANATTSTGRLILRGASDVYLYGGDGAGQNDGYNTLGGVRFNDPYGRIDWNMTGNLCFKGSRNPQAKIVSDNFLPHNAWNGGVSVGTESAAFRVDLLGTTQSCNSLFGGGKVTNGVSKTATVNIGENGNDCLFDVALCPGTPIDIVKKGVGQIELRKPVTGTFTLEEGAALVTGSSTFAAGTLLTAEGTRFEVRGTTFALPADYTASGALAEFTLTSGGVLRIGDDGADKVIDCSKIKGDAQTVIEKVGSNTITLQNATTFLGTVRVTGGTLAFDADVDAPDFASIEVAAGSTLDLASGLALRAHALDVRGAAGAMNGLYSGAAADGVTVYEGLTGAGTIRVTPASAVWTGAVDDDPYKASNWKGIVDAPDVVGGSFSGTFAEGDPQGTMDVAGALAFAGVRFTGDVASFTFRGTTADASLTLGTGGLSVDNRAATSPFAFDVRTPVIPSGAAQNWAFGSNTTLRLHGPLLGRDDDTSQITTTGAGTYYLYTTNSTYAGSFFHSAGTLYAYGSEPFGPSNKYGTATLSIYGSSATPLTFNNTTVSKPVVLRCNANARNTMYFPAGTTNVFWGNVRIANNNDVDGFDSQAGSTVVFAGGYGLPTHKAYVNWGTAGRVIITNAPFYGGTMEGATSEIHFYAKGNQLSSIMAWSNNTLPTYDAYNPHPVKFEFFTDWAFDCPALCAAFGGAWQLHGTEQRIGTLRLSSNGSIASWEAPGILHINHVNRPSGKSQDVPPSSGDFKGQFSLVKEGAGTFEIANRAVSATGRVTVVEGTFRLATTASWLNATNVVVTGGTFELNAANQLGKTTDFTLTAGALSIPEGVSQRAQWLYLDGAAKPAPRGIYGALDNTAVSPAFRTARITGLGTLNVVGDGKGLALIFR